jgi:Cyclic phosphodiesterase-like protein
MPTTATATDVKDEERRRLEERLQFLLKDANVQSTTESIGHRNTLHRKTNSSALFSLLDTPTASGMRHRARSMSLAEHPSLEKYYPGSHLLDDLAEDTGCFYLSLWLLPPMQIRTELAKEIAKLAMKHSSQGSSAPFMPHITVIGSIRCETHREVKELGRQLEKGLKGCGAVPCRFEQGPCRAMFKDEQVVWSQSCIAMMERSDEFMHLLKLSRQILNLPLGEWMFPGPACEPHFSKFYGAKEIPTNVPPPPDFVADEVALYMTTPGTREGVSKWREVTRIPLT